MKTWIALLTMVISIAFAAAAEAASFAKADPALQTIVNEIATDALKEFAPKKLTSNQLAITLVDLREATQPRVGSFRGDDPIYPASVVKLFYLAAAHGWMEDGKLKDAPELRRAMRDMIIDSSNDATHYVLDAVTDTTSGPELPDAEMKLWGEKRNVVNRYFTSHDYRGINVNQKPWGDGPYGRDRDWLGQNFTNRNSLTTAATARLLAQIATRQCISAARSDEMMTLLSRDRSKNVSAQEGQTHGYTAMGLPADAKLWSKAGWTSTARHDAAYVELADGRRFVLVTFTTGQAKEREIIAFVARQVVARL
ncbi:MAG TPA: serine hydrolase [Candidatus Acidoferrum sp.]|nr:serine hydrolase [Candidatus Acidoferrum sp.]